MKKEVEFVKSMTEKLKTQGDISENEAARIFILATVMYAYEMGTLSERRYWSDFRNKFNFSEISEALKGWYEEVFVRIDKRGNFIATIPSFTICPMGEYNKGHLLHTMKTMHELLIHKKNTLENTVATSDVVRVNEQMIEWLKNNVPLSFDIIQCESGCISFTRFGVLGLLPMHERKIGEVRLQELLEYDIPLLRCRNAVKGAYSFYDRVFVVACPIEYKDILDAAADGRPIPKKPPETWKTIARTPKDISYINSLTSRLPFRDITEDEADDIYLLLKMYQALRIAALKENGSLRRQIKDAAEPGLNALFSWYKAVEKKLAKNEHGNFVYTLPSDLNMHLYQLRKPIERCLEKLPKEPKEVITRYQDKIPVKDIFLDTRCIKTTRTSSKNEYAYYNFSRRGFFERNGIDLKKWKPVLRYEKYPDYNVLEYPQRTPALGKLRFAERTFGIKYAVFEGTVAVRKEDYPKIREVLNIPDDKIMEIVELLVQKELEKIRAEKERLNKAPEDIEKLRDYEIGYIIEKLGDLKYREKALKSESGIPLEYITKGIEIAYKAQKDKKEYIDDGNWMEMTR